MLLKRYIKEYNHFLNLKTVSILIRYANKVAFNEAAIGYGLVDKKIRKVHNHPFAEGHASLTNVHWANFLNYKICNLMNNYLKEMDLVKYISTITSLNQCEILKYEKEFHYTFHVDHSKLSDRTLSSIIFLNNDYKGGQLTFKNTFDNEEFIVEPSPGKIVIWPSNFLFPHCVKPVTEGIRYSIVAWGF